MSTQYSLINLNPHNRFCYQLQENTTSDIITNLTPGAQYRVVVYYTNGPLISPPSEPVIIDIGMHHLDVFFLMLVN